MAITSKLEMMQHPDNIPAYFDKYVKGKPTSLFRINPLATVINCNDECHSSFDGYFANNYDDDNAINDSDWTFHEIVENGKKSSFYRHKGKNDFHIYSIHCCYGSTEDLESLCQRRIAIPLEFDQQSMDILLSHVGNTNRGKCTGFTSDSIMPSLDKSFCRSLAYLFYSVGLLIQVE